MLRIVFLVLLWSSQTAWADQLYVFVGVDCTPQRIQIKFERAWNGEGELMLTQRRPNRWFTEELRKVDSDDDIHFQTKPISKTVLCHLGNVEFRVVVNPQFAPGWHPVGHCATRTGARVEIYRGEKRLIADGLDACTEDGSVPVSIAIRAGGSPTVTRMPAREFIWGS
ncbi:MAG: hypothetical protein EON93_14525 [Burkholderiales bacterium]|nr:MAG: hypothetical protein EON93_14525 [Burkholderiales bacterium]